MCLRHLLCYCIENSFQKCSGFISKNPTTLKHSAVNLFSLKCDTYELHFFNLNYLLLDFFKSKVQIQFISVVSTYRY